MRKIDPKTFSKIQNHLFKLIDEKNIDIKEDNLKVEDHGSTTYSLVDLPKLLLSLPRTNIYLFYINFVDGIAAELHTLAEYRKPSDLLGRLTYFYQYPAEQGGISFLGLMSGDSSWILNINCRDLREEMTNGQATLDTPPKSLSIIELNGSRLFCDQIHAQVECCKWDNH